MEDSATASTTATTTMAPPCICPQALVILEAMKTHRSVLWIDSGLELRAPMHT